MLATSDETAVRPVLNKDWPGVTQMDLLTAAFATPEHCFEPADPKGRHRFRKGLRDLARTYNTMVKESSNA